MVEPQPGAEASLGADLGHRLFPAPGPGGSSRRIHLGDRLSPGGSFMRIISSSHLLQTEKERTDHVLSSQAAQGDGAPLGRLQTLDPGTPRFLLVGVFSLGYHFHYETQPHLGAKP